MDELWDEGAVAGDDAAVGTALLMADLEAAIATAGDEIASLRRVTEAVPQPGLPPAAANSEMPVAERADEGLVPTTSGAADTPLCAPTDAALQVASPAQDPLRLPIVTPLPAVTRLTDTISWAAQWRAPPARSAGGGREAAESDADGSHSPPPDPPAADASQPATAPPVRASEQGPAPPDPIEPGPWIDMETDRPEAAAPGPLAAASSGQPVDRPRQQAPQMAAVPLDGAPVAQTAPTRGAEPASPRGAVETGAGLASERTGPAARDDEAGSDPGTRGEPTEGDVYLDGERVGRWMARYLARELGGPQAAATGFDPRLGPAWPGSLHGS